MVREAVGNDSDLYPLLVGRLRTEEEAKTAAAAASAEAISNAAHTTGRQADRQNEGNSSRKNHVFFIANSFRIHSLRSQGGREGCLTGRDEGGILARRIFLCH